MRGVSRACRTSCEISPYASSAVRRTSAFACYHSGAVCAIVEGRPLHYRAPLLARHPERPREPRPAAMRSAGEGVGFSCARRQHEVVDRVPGRPAFWTCYTGREGARKAQCFLISGAPRLALPGHAAARSVDDLVKSPPERGRRNGSEISISRPKPEWPLAVRERHLAQAKLDQQRPHCCDLPPRNSSAAAAVPCHEDILTCHIADIL